MLRNIRIRLFNSNNKRYKEYKKYWKLISKNPLKFDNIKSIKKLEELSKLNDEFRVAYKLSEEALLTVKAEEEFKKAWDNKGE